jgi:hypothetical protein
MKRVTAILFGVCLLSSLPAFAADEQQTTAQRGTVVAEAAQPVVLAAPLLPESRGRFDQRRVLTTLSVGLAGLEGYDAYSTLSVMGRGGVEANPLMRGLVSHPALFIGMKAGITGASIYAAERLWREHHRGAAIALIAVANGVMAAVAVNNASVLNASR